MQLLERLSNNQISMGNHVTNSFCSRLGALPRRPSHTETEIVVFGRRQRYGFSFGDGRGPLRDGSERGSDGLELRDAEAGAYG